MPYIFVTGYYPTHKTPEVVKEWFAERKKFPPAEFPGDISVDAASTATAEGLETVTIYRVTEENTGKALMRIIRTMVGFQSIEGFEYSIRMYSTPEEGLESIGMKMPE